MPLPIAPARLLLALACASAAIILTATTFGAMANDAAANTSPSAPTGDLARKSAILNSPEWRRAVFELGHWLQQQQIYSAEEVVAIKSRFNARVKAMSSYDLQYMLADLEEKLRELETPEAREARDWLGHYMSVLSDTKREELLHDIPDITQMSASELASELRKIEQKRVSLQRQQAATVSAREQILSAQQQSISATQQAVATASRSGGSSYSPYRSSSSNSGSPPKFDGGHRMSLGVGPFGAYVNMSL